MKKAEAMFEKLLPTRFKSFVMPITAAYCENCQPHPPIASIASFGRPPLEITHINDHFIQELTSVR
jgi:hypothetical protein